MSHIPTDDPTKRPWNSPGMVFCRGRYYYGMVMIPFVVMPGGNGNGGDVTGMLWRYKADPEEWIFTYRFRYYADKNNSAWDDRDRKTWYAVKGRGTEKEMVDKTRAAMNEIALAGMLLFRAMPMPPEWCLINGDADKAHEVLKKNPPKWMHTRTVDMDKNRKPTKVTTRMSDMPSQ